MFPLQTNRIWRGCGAAVPVSFNVCLSIYAGLAIVKPLDLTTWRGANGNPNRSTRDLESEPNQQGKKRQVLRPARRRVTAADPYA